MMRSDTRQMIRGYTYPLLQQRHLIRGNGPGRMGSDPALYCLNGHQVD